MSDLSVWVPVAVQVALGCPVLIVSLGLLRAIDRARDENRALTQQLISWFMNRLELSDPGIVPHANDDDTHDGNTDEIPRPPNSKPRR